MDKVFDLNHLSRETVVGQGRPPRTALVIGTTWSSEKSRSAGNRAADTLLSSYRWLPGFSKSSEKRPFAQTGRLLRIAASVPIRFRFLSTAIPSGSLFGNR